MLEGYSKVITSSEEIGECRRVIPRSSHHQRKWVNAGGLFRPKVITSSEEIGECWRVIQT